MELIQEKNKDNSKNGIIHIEPQRFPLEEELFPNMSKNDYASISLYACICLGSTGWSGYSNKKGMWRCTYKDLNEDGKILYNSLKKLYGNKATLKLVTWLDT